MHSDGLRHSGMFSPYLYFILYMTRGAFRSLMTVLILFITEERHLKRDVGTYS